MEPIFCLEDETFRIFCPICDKLCIDRKYQNHLKSQTHLKKLKQKSLTIRYIFKFISNFLCY